MNYNMQGINGDDSQALRDAEIDEGRNQEKHQVLMVDETTSFKNRAKEKKGKLQVEWQTSCHSREEDQSWTKA